MSEKKRMLRCDELTTEQQEMITKYHIYKPPIHRWTTKNGVCVHSYDLIFYSDGTTEENEGSIMRLVLDGEEYRTAGLITTTAPKSHPSTSAKDKSN